jgi:hypothetical protein
LRLSAETVPLVSCWRAPDFEVMWLAELPK